MRKKGGFLAKIPVPENHLRAFQSLPQAELFVRQRERPGLRSPAVAPFPTSGRNMGLPWRRCSRQGPHPVKTLQPSRFSRVAGANPPQVTHNCAARLAPPGWGEWGDGWVWGHGLLLPTWPCPLSLGPGGTSAPTGRKLLTRAWRQGPESGAAAISQGPPVLRTVPSCGAQPPAQRLLPPGAWLAAQLEVVPVPPGLCSPASVAWPTGRLEAVRGSREERLSGR